MKSELELSWVKGSSELPLITRTIPEQLQYAVEQWGDREALCFMADDIRMTYQELSQAVDNCACALHSLGLVKGDRLGIWAQNRLEWVLTQFATARLGIILVNINPSYRAKELDYVLKKVGCRALIFSDRTKFNDYKAAVRQLVAEPNCRKSLTLDEYPELNYLICMGEGDSSFFSFEELLAKGQEHAVDLDSINLDSFDPINIQFTSGTTGFPKGAVLTHHNILNNANFVTEQMHFSCEEKLCIPVPLYHCFGMVMGVLGCLSKGACMVFPGGSFNPRRTLQAIASEQCTAIYGVPAMYISMLAVANFAEYDLHSLRTGIMAGAPCPMEVMRQVIDDMSLPELTIAYGMTETSPVSFQSRVTDSLEKRVLTVGAVHPHVEVKLVNEEEEVVAVGEVGEIWTKGYSVMLNYWGDPERTADSIQDGWMRTGDLATLDEEGYCSIVGRLSDMVLRAGENIYPREVENYLYQHPAVQEVQVFGVPERRVGEELCAWIIVREGCRLDRSEVRDFCRGNIASYKIPQHIEFVDELPMSVTGKPQKFKMRDMMIERLGRSAE